MNEEQLAEKLANVLAAGSGCRMCRVSVKRIKEMSKLKHFSLPYLIKLEQYLLKYGVYSVIIDDYLLLISRIAFLEAPHCFRL